MATITVPSDPTLPVAGAEIKAAPLKDWITNIRTFIEATNIDEANVDTAGADGIVGKSIAQTITGLKTFSNTAAAAGGLREVAKFEINPASGTAAANDGLRMTFTADDAGGNATAVGYVDLKLTDASATSEDSEWRFSTISNASSVTPLVVNATSITMTTGTVAIGTNATIGGGLTVTGTGIFGALTVGSAAISEAELEMLDGLTGGTVTASKAVVVDGNKDIASFRNVTLTGELDAATLDISGDADIDGTLEADAITLGGTALGSLYSPIAGSSSIVTVGTVGTGTWQGSVIASAYLDSDTAHLSGSQTFTGDKAFTGTVTVGVDGTGKDVTFYGDTSGSKVVWDESADDLIFTNSGIAVGSDATGDIYYRNSSGHLTRLGVGSNGEVLTTNGTIPSWGSAGGSGDFSGPGSATDNAVVRFNGTGGKTGQNSGVTIDDSNNATGFANLTLSGELDAATGDFSGDVDVDGTLEADAITLGGTALGSIYSPIAGSSSITTVGTIGTGTWQGTAIASAYLDSDTAHLSGTQTFSGAKTFSAAAQFSNTVTVGANDQGYDVILYGDTASANITWDTSEDDLIANGAARIVVPDGQMVLGSTAISSTAAEINLLDALSRGSILYGNASGATTVLTKGGAGTVLTSDGTDISWAAATGGHTIQEEGSSLTQRTKLNFIGAGVTATDDSGNDATKITVTPTGASLPVTRSDGSTSDPIALTSAALGESLVSDTSPQLGGNLDVNGQSIVSDSGNENIPITPHGTGSVVVSKIDVAAGEIDGTAIGANSASTGAFTTLAASGTTTLSGDQHIANGNGLVVGHTAHVAIGSSGEFQVFGTAAGDSETTTARFSADSGGPSHAFLKSRHGSIGSSTTIVQDDDELGGLIWYADDGNDFYSSSARIFAAIDGSPSENDVPGRLVFATTADGANSPTERMRIEADGDVRIGGVISNESSTINAGLVSISGAADGEFAALTLRNSQAQDTGTNETTRLDLTWADGGGNTAAGSAIIAGKEGTYATAGTANSYLAFSTTASNTVTERMRIDSSGNVGVGSNDPDSAAPTGSATPRILKIASGAGIDNALQIQGVNDDHGLDLWTDVSTGYVYLDQRGDHDSYSFRFRTKTTATPIEAMIIQGSGNVGIGHTSPGYRLNVVGDSSGWLSEFRNDHSSSPLGLTLYWPNAAPDNNTNLFFNCQDSSAARAKIYADGDVWTSDAGTLTSDERLKTNIVDATDKLADVMRLKVRNFEWTPEYHPNKVGEKKIGFIAQELEEVFPSLVSEHDIAPDNSVQQELYTEEDDTQYYVDGDDIPDGKEIGDVKAESQIPEGKEIGDVKVEAKAHEPTMRKSYKNAFGPILVKALQEVTTRLEAAEAKIAALEAA